MESKNLQETPTINIAQIHQLAIRRQTAPFESGHIQEILTPRAFSCTLKSTPLRMTKGVIPSGLRSALCLKLIVELFGDFVGDVGSVVDVLEVFEFFQFVN